MRTSAWISICALSLALTACGDDVEPERPTPDGADDAGEDSGSGATDAGSDAAEGSAAPEPVGVEATMLPQAPEPCETLETGTLMVLGTRVNLWVGERQETQKAPIYIWWHGTGGVGSNATAALGEVIDEIVAQGGVVAAPNETTSTGDNTGNNVWYTGDFEIADQIVACAVEQLNIDTQRIYTGGASAGGLQAGVMAYQRSGYIANSVPNSGGIVFINQRVLQDEEHIPAVMTLHGAMGADVVYIDFSNASRSLDRDLADRGGFVINCDHGGGHVGAPAELRAAAWEFQKAHPFGVEPEPYAEGLPESFPDYCVIVE